MSKIASDNSPIQQEYLRGHSIIISPSEGGGVGYRRMVTKEEVVLRVVTSPQEKKL